MLDEDEEAVGDRGNPWWEGAMSLTGRSAATMLEVFEEELNNMTKTKRGRWRSRALGERRSAYHVEVDAWGRRSEARATVLRHEGATQRRRVSGTTTGKTSGRRRGPRAATLRPEGAS